MNFTAPHARWFRMQRQGLVQPFADPLEATRNLAGIQAQIPPAAAIALWNRSAACSAADVQRMLFDERRMVKLWSLRGTMHMHSSDDWPLLHATHAERRSYTERVLESQGKDLRAYEDVITAVTQRLHEQGSLGRSDLRVLRNEGVAISDEDLSGWGGIFRVLLQRGIACHGPGEAGEARIVPRSTWLPQLAWNPPSAAEADLILARRYFRAYGPATLGDLSVWRGRNLRETKHYYPALASELQEIQIDGVPHFILRDDLETLAATPPPREQWPVKLLGRFDPLLLAHRDKTWIVDKAHYNKVWRPAGHIEATVLVHGRIAGTWRYDWRAGGIVITVRPFSKLPAYVNKAVQRNATQLAAHFGVALSDLVWENST